MDAIKTMSYVDAVYAIEWILMFITGARELDKTSRIPYANLIDTFNTLLTQYRELVDLNAKCETLLTSIETSSAPSSTDVEQLEQYLTHPDGKKISGGEQRYKHMTTIIKEQHDSAHILETYEWLTLEYDQLCTDIKHYKYGFDFTTQRDRIRELKDSITTIQKKLPPDLETNRKQRRYLYTPQPSHVLKNLDKLLAHTNNVCSYLETMTTKQPIIASDVTAVPITLSNRDTTFESTRLSLKRIPLVRDHATYFNVTTVFNEQQIVDHRTVPVEFTISHSNFIFRIFTLGNTTTITTAPLITSKYKTITVAAAVTTNIRYVTRIHYPT